MDYARVVGVLLAAGAGSRFGGNKLEAMLGGTMLGMHAAKTLSDLGLASLIAVHDPANAALASALHGAGLNLIANRNPAAGLSHSLALAARAADAMDVDAMLVVLADMPFVTADHFRRLIELAGDDAVTSIRGKARMPPAVFARAQWAALGTLTGDVGARTLLDSAKLVAGSAKMLADIDTPDDFARWS